MPTAGFVAASADDRVVIGTGPTYPPAYSGHNPATDANVEVSKNFENPNYVLRNGLFCFDTSSCVV